MVIKKIWEFIKSERDFQKLSRVEKDNEIQRRVNAAILEMQLPSREAEERVEMEVANFLKFKKPFSYLIFYPQHSGFALTLPIYEPDFERTDWREYGEGVYKYENDWTHFNCTKYGGSREKIYPKQIIKFCYTMFPPQQKIESSLINRTFDSVKNFFYA